MSLTVFRMSQAASRIPQPGRQLNAALWWLVDTASLCRPESLHRWCDYVSLLTDKGWPDLVLGMTLNSPKGVGLAHSHSIWKSLMKWLIRLNEPLGIWLNQSWYVQSNPVIPPTMGPSCLWRYDGVDGITEFHNLTWSTYINTLWRVKRHKAMSSATLRLWVTSKYWYKVLFPNIDFFSERSRYSVFALCSLKLGSPD